MCINFLFFNLLLSLPAPPLFVDSSINVTTVEGQEVTLPCSTLPDPTLSFTWFFNDVQISLPGDDAVLLANGSLHISSVENSEEGVYTCQARNNLGTAEGTVFLSVFGMEKYGKQLVCREHSILEISQGACLNTTL